MLSVIDQSQEDKWHIIYLNVESKIVKSWKRRVEWCLSVVGGRRKWRVAVQWA